MQLVHAAQPGHLSSRATAMRSCCRNYNSHACCADDAVWSLEQLMQGFACIALCESVVDVCVSSVKACMQSLQAFSGN